MKERHETEAQKLRSDVDQATSRAREVEAQYNSLRQTGNEKQQIVILTLINLCNFSLKGRILRPTNSYIKDARLYFMYRR